MTGLTAKGSVHVETGSVSAAPALGPLVPLHCPPCAQGRAGQGMVSPSLSASSSMLAPAAWASPRRPADREACPSPQLSHGHPRLPQWPSLGSEVPRFSESQPRRETLRVFCWEDLR